MKDFGRGLISLGFLLRWIEWVVKEMRCGTVWRRHRLVETECCGWMSGGGDPVLTVLAAVILLFSTEHSSCRGRNVKLKVNVEFH